MAVVMNPDTLETEFGETYGFEVGPIPAADLTPRSPVH